MRLQANRGDDEVGLMQVECLKHHDQNISNQEHRNPGRPEWAGKFEGISAPGIDQESPPEHHVF